MKIIESIKEVRQIRWSDPVKSWGLVPTMGFLHDGHLSLVRRAVTENDKTAVSIFVNPTQFSPTEDLSAYPRSVERDLAMLEAAGVDMVFMPTDAIIYPAGFQTTVAVDDITRPLEGASRPTHFQGVATVVAKLFNIVQPMRAYFGQKDAQQAAVLRRMVTDLNFNLELIVCPIVREADGLAMSSRNAYLTGANREAATVLSRALRAAEAAYMEGERNGRLLQTLITDIINAEPLARLDYASVADPITLQELDVIEEGALLLTAVFIDKTRLIDNILLT